MRELNSKTKKNKNKKKKNCINRGRILNIETKNFSILKQKTYNRQNHIHDLLTLPSSPLLHFPVHQTYSCTA